VEFEKVDNPSTIDTPYLERDPGLRISINTYPIDKREDVRMTYINMGPFQPELQKYPSTKHENKLRLKTTIVATKWLAKQACTFRGHDESVNSLNRGNFIELIKLLAIMNEKINKVVLENTLKNAQYIAPKIQKELLNILANKVRHKIQEEIEDAKFCILVDEALDESHKEQMTIILRHIDCDGFIRERFFKVVNVDDTKASTLKNEICNVLAQYNLLIENLRGANQVWTLQRAGDTRWSSHFTSVSRLIDMFSATLEVLRKMINDGPTRDMHGEAKDKSLDILNALNYVTSTKRLLQEFRDNGWDDFIRSVASFCGKHDIIVPDMSVCYC
ncbi:hypothetical protein CISIN_1g035944mg, partial [Citrus sinensis]